MNEPMVNASGLVWPTLLSLMGQVAALDFTMHAVIASHPRQDIMRYVWNTYKIDWLDSMLEHSIYGDSTEFREAVNGVLGRMEAAQQAAPTDT